MRLIATIALTGVALASASSAEAQSVRAFAEEGRAETRVMAGISIPFGGPRSNDSAPRMDLRLQSARIGQSTAEPVVMDRAPDDYLHLRESRISLTFEDEPRFLVNGRSFASYRLQAGQEQEQPDEQSSQDPDEEGISDEERRKRRERRRREAAVDVLRPVAKGALIAGGVVAVGLGVIVLGYATSDDSD